MKNYKVILENGNEFYFSAKSALQSSDNVLVTECGIMSFKYPIVNVQILNNKSIDSNVKDNYVPEYKDIIMSNPEEFLPMAYRRLYDIAINKKMLKEASNIDYIMGVWNLMIQRRYANIILNEKDDIEAIRELSNIVDNVRAVFG